MSSTTSTDNLNDLILTPRLASDFFGFPFLTKPFDFPRIYLKGEPNRVRLHPARRSVLPHQAITC